MCEQNVSFTERDSLGISWVISKYLPRIYDSQFKIVIYHRSIVWLSGLYDPSGVLICPSLKLQDYDLSVIYKSGEHHLEADSHRCRRPTDTPVKRDTPS